MAKPSKPYTFPASLKLLGLYLKAKGYDTGKLRSDRHAVDLIRRATGWRIKFPPKGVSCYPLLRRLHNDLFPSVPLNRAPAKKRRVRGLGTFGPASRCRTIDPHTMKTIVTTTAVEGRAND